MMLVPQIVTPPAGGAVTLQELKLQGRYDSAEEDALLATYGAASTAYLDGYSGILGKALITQTWSVSLSGFDGDRLDIPLGPVQSILSVMYQDAEDQAQTFSSYRAHRDARGDYIKLVDGADWPETAIRDDAVTITWVAGYGDNMSDVPEPIRQAIYLLSTDFAMNREATTAATLSELPFGVKALLAPFALRTF